MPLNVKLLREIQKEISEEPKRLDMGTWLHKYEKHRISDLEFVPPCGTVGCIAGWAKILSERAGVVFTNYGTSLNACIALDIQEEDSIYLFYTDHWPDDLQYRYNDADDAKDYTEKAAVTCEAIDRFIEKHTQQEALLSELVREGYY